MQLLVSLIFHNLPPYILISEKNNGVLHFILENQGAQTQCLFWVPYVGTHIKVQSRTSQNINIANEDHMKGLESQVSMLPKGSVVYGILD